MNVPAMELYLSTSGALYYLTNLNQSKETQLNVEGVKTEAPETNKIQFQLLQHQLRSSITPEKLFSAQSESSKSDGPDISSNTLLDLKAEKVAQECHVESIKQELLHEELDIKSEECGCEKPGLDNTCNWGNQCCKYRKTVNSLKCSVCSYRCEFSSDFKNTMYVKTHTGGKPYKCNICNYSSNKSCHLKDHLRIHTGEKPFKCTICDDTFRKNNTLKKHLRTHTGQKLFKCNICENIFGLRQTLQAHLKSHTGDKPFKCNICDKSFELRQTLQAHLKSHTGDKPFKCNICVYSSKQIANFISHLSTHTQNINLKNHLRNCTGEKHFKCYICDNSFRLKYDLKTHLRTHTGEKPFKCNVCDHRSAQKSNLKRHLRTHTIQ